jgi:NADH-quinone oxidoreductase subunit A
MGSAHVWPLAVYFVLAFGAVAAMIAVSYVLGERRKNAGIQSPYESGIVPSSSGKLQYSVKYYLIAMFFVVFDVESVFIFAWAVAFRELGWSGYVAMVVFIGVLLAMLAYLWRVGALDWGAAGKLKQKNHA